MQNPVSGCPHCHAQISPHARFCKSCGKSVVVEQPSAPPLDSSALENKCAYCGTALSANARFCKACGKAVSPTISKPNPVQVAAPTPPRTIKQPATPRRSGSKGGMLIVSGCVAIILLCLLGVVGIYFAFRSGAITQKQLLNLAGVGPGTVTLMNFRDDPIQATLTTLQEDKNGRLPSQNLSLKAYEINSRDIDQGKYRIEFRQQGASALLAAACALTIRAGDNYRLIALPNGVMINRTNAPSKKTADLIPETSAFCR